MFKIEKIKYLINKTDAKNNSDNKRVFILIFVFAGFGTLASFFLTVYEFYLLKNPDAKLACSINAIINCASIMQTWQASILGFPNSLIGLMAYPVLMTLSLLGYLGQKLPKNLFLVMYVGIASGLLFAHWLFFESLYSIKILCPWCLLVILSTIVIFSASTHYLLRNNLIDLNKKLNSKVQNFLNKDYDKLITVSWIVLLVALIFANYGNRLFA